MKPEISKLWTSFHSSLQSYIKYFHKLIVYYIINYNYYYNINNIWRQVIGHVISMKRKQRTILKTQYRKQDKYQPMINTVLPSDSDLLYTNTQKGCCLLNANEYNNKLRCVIGWEDVSEVTKWTWFNKQVRDTLFCLWMMPRKLIDGSNIRRLFNQL